MANTTLGIQPNPIPAEFLTGNSLLCLWNIRSYPWWQLLYYAPNCVLDVDNSFGKRVTNVLDGAKDIAQITASFAFMYFLWSKLSVPEKDAHHHYQTIVIAPTGLDLRIQTLEEAAKANPVALPLALSLKKAETLHFDEEYVAITADKLGVDLPESFWVRKFDYNNLAKEYKFQEER